VSARGSKEARLVYGASPRVDLLPPEVADRKKGAALRRAIAMGVVGALVISAGAYAFASWQSIQAAGRLADAQAETTSLLSQQAEFAEVKTLSAQGQTISDARMTGALTEINWNAFYREVLPTLPPDVVIGGFIVETSSPIREYVGTSVPTVDAPAAQVGFALVSPNLESLAAWLVALKTFPGYAQATMTPAVLAGGVYTSTMTLNLSDARYTKRFAPPEEPPAETADTAVTPAEPAEGEGTN
jgi:hypothetical protein